MVTNQQERALSDAGADETRFSTVSGTGKYAEAVKRLYQLKKTRPSDVSLRLALVDAYFKAGMNSHGERETQELLNSSMLSITEGELLVRILVKDKQTQTAEQALEKLVTTWPDSADAHAELGLLLSAKSQFRSAVRELGRAAQLEPDSAKYNLVLAQMLLEWHHYSTAYDFLTAIEHRFGKLPRFEYFLAFSLYGLRRDDGAIAELNKLLQEHPRYAQAYYLLGDCYIALGDRRKAVEAFKKAIQIKPNRGPYYTSLADVLRESSYTTDQAISYAKKAVELDPSSSDAVFELALCYESNKDYARAQLLLEEITRAHPELIPPHRVLAQVYYREGKISEAERQTKIITALEKRQRVLVPEMSNRP